VWLPSPAAWPPRPMASRSWLLYRRSVLELHSLLRHWRGDAPVSAKAKTSLSLLSAMIPARSITAWVSSPLGHQPDEDRKPAPSQPALALCVLPRFRGPLAGSTCQQALVGLLAARHLSSCWVPIRRRRSQRWMAKVGRVSYFRSDVSGKRRAESDSDTLPAPVPRSPFPLPAPRSRSPLPLHVQQRGAL